MATKSDYERVWVGPDYRRGSCAQRLVPFFATQIPAGSVINDYGSGTGRAAVELNRLGYKVNMVDFASNAIEKEALDSLSDRLTYTVADLTALPSDFPVADWGVCVGVLMLVDDIETMHRMLAEMRRTCKNIIIETHNMDSNYLGFNWAKIRGNGAFWAGELGKHWDKIEAIQSTEHALRYITIGRN